jgi:hypothetical protein
MSPRPGALIIWHDVAAGFDAELDAWYQQQHLPERLAVPGFRSGRRYRGTGSGPGYLALYETETVEVLGSPAYQARLADPTEWTRRVMPNFRSVVRTACTVEFDGGGATGGTLAVVPLPGRPDLPPLDDPAIQRVRLLRADPGVTRVPNPEARDRPAPDALAEWVLLVEAISPEAAEAALAGFPRPMLFRLMCAVEAM